MDELLLADLIVAGTISVLESFSEAPSEDVARTVRSIVAFAPIRTLDPALLLRSLELYETHRIDYAEAYLVASAQRAGATDVAPFGQRIDRVTTVTRVEPGQRRSRRVDRRCLARQAFMVGIWRSVTVCSLVSPHQSLVSGTRAHVADCTERLPPDSKGHATATAPKGRPITSRARRTVARRRRHRCRRPRRSPPR